MSDDYNCDHPEPTLEPDGLPPACPYCLIAAMEENERLKLDAKRARLDLEKDRESSEWMTGELLKTKTVLELLQENNDRLCVELQAARRVIERVLVWREATSEDEQIGASDELDKALADYSRVCDSQES